MIQLQQDESILWRSNTHPILLVLRIIAAFLVAGLQALLAWWAYGAAPRSGAQGVAIAVFVLVFGGASTVLYLRWRSRTFFVTSYRLARSEGVIGKKVNTLALDKVQDVTYTLSIAGRILNFGTVAIESAGAQGKLFFDCVPSPMQVANQILTAARAARGPEVIQCRQCGKKLDPSWNLCPFCGMEISPLASPPEPREPRIEHEPR